MREVLKEPVCAECHCHHVHHGAALWIYSIWLIPGLRYCLSKETQRRFIHSDPRVYVPSWCPKRKDPCEVRLYRPETGMEKESRCSDAKNSVVLEGRRYTMASEFQTELTPQKFWKRCWSETAVSLLGVDVQRDWIMEIDDGLKPIFFCKGRNRFRIVNSPKVDQVQKMFDLDEGYASFFHL